LPKNILYVISCPGKYIEAEKYKQANITQYIMCGLIAVEIILPSLIFVFERTFVMHKAIILLKTNPINQEINTIPTHIAKLKG
jgi:hypothetical protein